MQRPEERVAGQVAAGTAGVVAAGADVGRHVGAGDRWGQRVSLLCLVHCLVTPLLLAAVPAAADSLTLLEDPWVHRALGVGVVATAAWAFLPGFRRHRRVSVLLLAGLGVGGVLLGLGLPEEWMEAVATVLGSALLVVAHTLNRRCAAGCAHPHAAP